MINHRYRLFSPLRPLNAIQVTEVFDAIDLQQPECPKVIKILKSTHLEDIDRFEREAIALQLLQSPGLPTVDDDGLFNVNVGCQKRYCLVLHKVPGTDLEQWLAHHGPISEEIAITWLQQLVEILDYIHNHNFFHRDLKPQNIMLQPDGQLVLIDFGSVRAISETYLLKLRDPEQRDITRIVSEGYTPTEQISGRALLQSDFYALGRTFVHLLTGEHPSQCPINPTTKKLLWHHKAPKISRAFADWLDTLMTEDYTQRPSSAKAIEQQLSASSRSKRQLLYAARSPVFLLTGAAALIACLSSLFIGLRLLAEHQASIKVNKLDQLTLNQDQDGQQAIRSVEDFLDRCPPEQEAQDCSEILAQQGRSNLVNNKLQEAQVLLKQAIELQPNESTYHNDLGLVCIYLGDYPCATESLEQAIALEQSNPKWAAHYNLAFSLERQAYSINRLEAYKRAIDRYEMVANQNEDEDSRWYAVSRRVRLQLWLHHLLKTDISSTIDSLDRALAEVQAKIERLTVTHSDMSTSNGDQAYVKTVQVLKSALLKNKGWAFWLQGDLTQALNVLETAYEINSDQVDIVCLLALVKEDMGVEIFELRPLWQSCLHMGSFFSNPEITTWQNKATSQLKLE